MVNFTSFSPETPILQAFSILENIKNRRDTLETYLEDGRCSFSNNLSENAIRLFTVDRKNWLFSESPEGAKASATVYTMVEMAKAHNYSQEKNSNICTFFWREKCTKFKRD